MWNSKTQVEDTKIRLTVSKRCMMVRPYASPRIVETRRLDSHHVAELEASARRRRHRRPVRGLLYRSRRCVQPRTQERRKPLGSVLRVLATLGAVVRYEIRQGQARQSDPR